jgi:hypothetical protein
MKLTINVVPRSLQLNIFLAAANILNNKENKTSNLSALSLFYLVNGAAPTIKPSNKPFDLGEAHLL